MDYEVGYLGVLQERHDEKMMLGAFGLWVLGAQGAPGGPQGPGSRVQGATEYEELHLERQVTIAKHYVVTFIFQKFSPIEGNGFL